MDKVRLLVGDHMTKASATILHACVVSRETVRIELMNTAHNDLR